MSYHTLSHIAVSEVMLTWDFNGAKMIYSSRSLISQLVGCGLVFFSEFQSVTPFPPTEIRQSQIQIALTTGKEKGWELTQRKQYLKFRAADNRAVCHYSPKVNSVLCNTTCPSEAVTSGIIFAWRCGNPTQQDYFRPIPLCSVLQLLYTQLHWSLRCLHGSAQFIRDLGSWVESAALQFFFKLIVNI